MTPKILLPESPIGCSMDALLRLLMGQWTIYIIWVLRNQETLRFGDLRRSVSGVSAKVLTEKLRVLEQVGMVSREVLPTNPPQVKYGLTAHGHQLAAILDQLKDFATTCCEQKTAPNSLAKDSANEEPTPDA